MEEGETPERFAKSVAKSRSRAQAIFGRIGYYDAYIEKDNYNEIANRNLMEHLFVCSINNASIT